MSTTTSRADRVRDDEARVASTPLAPPPRLRRRPALVATAIAAICLGALLAAWAWTATTSTQEVLVARASIERGAAIEADDLARVQLSADPALSPVAASDFDLVAGQRATVDIAAGSMLTPGSYGASVLPAEGESVVGVALTPAQAPGLDLQNGDLVRIVVTPAQGESASAGSPLVNDAEVVGVHVDDLTGQTVVDVVVPRADAAVLATRVATGNVALILDSRER